MKYLAMMVEMGCLLINFLAASRIMLMMTSCFEKELLFLGIIIQ